MSSKEKSGMKFDAKKPMWSLLPLKVVEQFVVVLTLGADKYDPFNWQKVEDNFYGRYSSALMRHIAAWQDGNKYDADFFEKYGVKVSHLAFAGCNVIFLLWKEMQDSKGAK